MSRPEVLSIPEMEAEMHRLRVAYAQAQEALRQAAVDLARLRATVEARNDYIAELRQALDLRQVAEGTGIPLARLERAMEVQEDDPGPIATEPQYRKKRPDDPRPVRADSVTPGEPSGHATTPDPSGFARPVPDPGPRG